jgi:hypothetical protein
VPVDTTAYKLNGSLPVVGTSTAVFAAIGNPVEVVTPEPPTNEAALELISTPSLSGAGPLVNIAVAAVPVATELPTYSNSRSVRPCSRRSSFCVGYHWARMEFNRTTESYWVSQSLSDEVTCAVRPDRYASSACAP